ncbi:ABC transporter ATP-binding protein [Bifidobacterium sp. CP2]|uniref:ABC transporter ATP-binding protein n=1 Tax=Bifidobacterium sp. CP2 TaxID=2809025 RepID=UPI001BDD5A6A|nr:ABC transporter ATP-binding protein [Bifidobacterium sp. CP2]MBT1180544.1 ABC transporter ATP-binding protein [Bifidobacterium sp. CP2]
MTDDTKPAPTTAPTTTPTGTTPTDRTPLIDASHAALAFDGRPVLRDVSFTLHAGEFVSLIGRSGCGKSTLLRIVAGLLEPTGGGVRATGSQAIGFQDSRLVPWIRLWDNVTLGLPGSKAERREIARKALEQVQLADHMDSWPSSLSGGQAQRASLARALVRAPELLLLDEPFGALDSLTRYDMQDLLASLEAEHDWGVLMVTHDIAEAVRLSDRVLVMSGGVIAQDITIDRSETDAEGRPAGHVALEDRLRAALR